MKMGSFRALALKWWSPLPLLLLFAIPSIAARPVDSRDTSLLVTEVLSQPLVSVLPAATYPIFKLVPLALVIGVIVAGRRAGRIFSLYAGANVLLLAFVQNAGHTPSYGFAVLTGNVVVYALVGLFWLWEGARPHGTFSMRTSVWWRYWVVPLALLAFWFPTNDAVQPDFSTGALFANQAGLTLCMMLPVYLAVLTVHHPSVNVPLMRTTAIAGAATGLLNLLQWFALRPEWWWMGILHLPLVTISVYAFLLPLAGRATTARPTAEAA